MTDLVRPHPDGAVVAVRVVPGASAAKAYRDAHITKVDSWAEFQEVLESKGGFLHAHWDGTTETEEAIKEKTKATIRCIPLGWEEEAGVCVLTGKPSGRRVLFAKAY